MPHDDSRHTRAGSFTISRRQVLTAGAVGLGLIVAPGMAAAAFADTPAPAADPSRFITIDGSYNVRDVGGYSTPTGASIPWGRMYRSSSLSAVTDLGVSQLAALNLSSVANFLSHAEKVESGPDRLPAGVASISAPIGDVVQFEASLNLVVNARLGAPWEGANPMPNGANPLVTGEFRTYVAATEARMSLGTALRAVAAAGGRPFLWHCNSGTYRTGWATAVLLTAIGIRKSDVYDDFLLSNVGLGGTFAVPEYLDAAFDQTHISFGSFDDYLQDGLGIGEDVVAQLQAALLG